MKQDVILVITSLLSIHSGEERSMPLNTPLQRTRVAPRRSPLNGRPLNGFVTTVILATTLCWAAEVPPPRGVETSSGSGVVSPTVVASWVARTAPGGLPELELLVLWRGTPGWFMRADSSGSSGSVSTRSGGDDPDPGLLVEHLSYGGIRLGLEFDRRNHTARLQYQEVTLGSSNVVLMDDVDAESGPRVAGSLEVKAQFPESPAQVEAIIRRSPELFAYLRCDAKLPDSKDQVMIDSICALMKNR